MKKFMIRCDIEGISGVVSYDQSDPGKPEYLFGLKMLMSDLMAAVEGLNEGGADEIHVYDTHFDGRNIDLTALPKNTFVICGKPPYRSDWAGGLDETFSGLILIGLHSKYGTGELLHHSFELNIKDIRLNGLSVGEIGMESAIAGELGVSVLLVCGDDKACEETKNIMPDTKTVVVKKSLGPTGGLCFPVEKTFKEIFEAAKNVSGSVGEEDSERANSFRIESPAAMEIEFNPGVYLDSLKKLHKERIVEGNTIVIKKDSVLEAWAEYLCIENDVLSKVSIDR